MKKKKTSHRQLSPLHEISSCYRRFEPKNVKPNQASNQSYAARWWALLTASTFNQPSQYASSIDKPTITQNSHQ